MSSPEPVDLPAGPVRLRQWRDDDLEATWAALHDPDIRRWNGDGSASREDALQLIRRRQDWSSGDHASWAIADPDSDRLLGSVSLFRIDQVQGSAEIGYWTASAARGRGAATHAVTTVCAWAFDVLALERIGHDELLWSRLRRVRPSRVKPAFSAMRAEAR